MTVSEQLVESAPAETQRLQMTYAEYLAWAGEDGLSDEVKLWPDGPSREPDLVFIAKDHLARITADRIEGPPDLIVEIVSDDSVHRDRVDKFDEYETAGVAEYWIVDNRPRRRRAYFYQLSSDGKYEQAPPIT